MRWETQRFTFDGEKRKLYCTTARLLFRVNLCLGNKSHEINQKYIPQTLPLQMWTPTPTSHSHSNSNSSPSTFAAEAPAGLHKNMEDVWKDISLSSDLQFHPSSRGRMILLDFFSSDPPPAVSPPPPQPPMHTLSSVRDHRPIVSTTDLIPVDHHHNAAGVAGKKRLPEPERNSGDRRHKRMIKNRESAARSRARKQAYTNELELEVAHLLEENARLKKQQQQWHEAAEFHQHSKKNSLYRTWTAPF